MQDAAGLLADKNAKPGHLSLADIFVLRGSVDIVVQYNERNPLPVLGSVSASEAEGLGKSLQRLASKQTDTTLTGLDSMKPATTGTGTAWSAWAMMGWVSRIYTLSTGTWQVR